MIAYQMFEIYFWEWHITSSESCVRKNAGKSFQEREPLGFSYTAVFSVVTQTSWMLLLTNQLHDSFEYLSVIDNQSPVSIALLSLSSYTKKTTYSLPANSTVLSTPVVNCLLYQSGRLCRRAFFDKSFQWKWAPNDWLYQFSSILLYYRIKFRK